MKRADRLSVIIPSYNAPKEDLEILNRSLNDQTFGNFEVILVDDFSDFNHYKVFEDSAYMLNIVTKDENSGPAATRNLGVENSSGKYLFFTDTDCKLEEDTLEKVYAALQTNDIVAGDTITRTSTTIGRAIARLGFPGGGNIGFHSVWRVDKNRFTSSFSSCNVGMRTQVFYELNGFDTSSPVPGGEDTIFASKAVREGWRIKYNIKQIVYHKEKRSIKSFFSWQITRGRGNYYIKRGVPGVSGYLRLRVWSFMNSLRKSGVMAPFVFLLIFLSVVLQSYGYYLEKFRVSISGRKVNA